MAKKQISEDEFPKVKLNKDSLQRASRIFKFMGPHKWKFVIGMFFLAGTSAVALIFPKLMGNLMGVIGKTESMDMLLNIANTVGLQLMILFGIQAVFSFFRVVLFVNVTENMLAGLRRAAFDRLIRRPMDFFSSRQSSELNSRISSDITQIGETFTTGLAEFLRQPIIIIGGIIVICFTSGKLALVMVSIIPIISLLAVFFGKRIRNISRAVQDKIAESNLIVGE